MATGANWVLNLLDNVTRPAGVIDATLARLENRISAVDRGLSRLSGRLGSLSSGFRAASLAGEGSAHRIGRAWDGVHRSVQGAQQGMNSLLSTTLQLSAAGAVAGYAGKKVLDLAGMREMQLTQVETALGERDPIKVKAAVQWINKFADETPFTDSQTMMAVRQTLGWGFKWNEMQGITRILGDATTMNASDPADASYRLNRSIRALGQIRSKGVLQAEEVNQLQESIPGISAILDREFGPRRKDMQRKGQITASMAISAILKGLSEGNTAGGMQRMSQTLFGLTSTLASRPQRIIGMLYDNGGLDPVKQFLRNLISLTDFTKEPGKRAVTQLAAGGKRLISALFGPLNRATEGRQADLLVNRLVRGLDGLTLWFERNGPVLRQEAAGFGAGLKTAADGAEALLRPVAALAGFADRAGGGSGEGMLGKILGVGVGAAVLARLGNFLSFGLLGKLGAGAGKALIGGISKTWAGSGWARGGWARQMFMQSVRGGGWLRALGLANLGTQIGRIGLAGLFSGSGTVATGLLRAVPVIGAIAAGLGIVKSLGDAAYRKWEPFADLIDRIRENLGWILKPADQQNTALGRALAFDFGKFLTGKPQAWEESNNKFVSAVDGVASRLGVNAQDLLKVMNFESGLNPAARNRQSGATGLIQFMPETARELGTTTRALGRMTREEQLPFIERYLREHGVRPGMGLEQLYMSVLSGSANRSGNLWQRGSIQYEQNSGLDIDRDGIITSNEAVRQVQLAWQRGERRIEQTLNITIAGNADPAAMAALQNAVRTGALDAWNTTALEGGWSP